MSGKPFSVDEQINAIASPRFELPWAEPSHQCNVHPYQPVRLHHDPFRRPTVHRRPTKTSRHSGKGSGKRNIDTRQSIESSIGICPKRRTPSPPFLFLIAIQWFARGGSQLGECSVHQAGASGNPRAPARPGAAACPDSGSGRNSGGGASVIGMFFSVYLSFTTIINAIMLYERRAH